MFDGFQLGSKKLISIDCDSKFAHKVIYFLLEMVRCACNSDCSQLPNLRDVDLLWGRAFAFVNHVTILEPVNVSACTPPESR